MQRSSPWQFTAVFVRKLVTAFYLTLAGCLFVSSAQAGWLDPLDTPSIASKKVAFNLLLDITRAGERLVVVGERGHIAFSDDEGLTWQQAKTPISSTLTAVYFANENDGWAVGHDGAILRTADGALTWEKQLDGFQVNQTVFDQAEKTKEEAALSLNNLKNSANPRLISQAEERLENATYAVEDARADFEDKSTKPFLDVWFKDANTGFVVGAYGLIFKTTDGGKHWQDWSVHVPNPDRFHFNAITSVGDNRLMLVGEMGTIMRSADNGNTWQKLQSPYGGSLFGINSLFDNKVLLAFGLRGNVLRSENQGSTWKSMDSGTEQGLSEGFVSNDRTIYLVGNGGAFLKGVDEGQKWLGNTRSGRKAAAGIVESKSGYFVVVGENGVELIDKAGNHLPNVIKSLEFKG